MGGWDWDQFDPAFGSRLRAMIEEGARTGHNITLTSGRRSIEEQIALRSQNGCPDVWSSPASSCRVPTAIPGQSRHNMGMAADIGGDREWAHANAERFGLHFNVQGEDWHIEMIGDDDATGAQQFNPNGPISFGFDYMNEPMNPEDELARRLFAMKGILETGTPEVDTQDPTVDPTQIPRDVHTIGADMDGMLQSMQGVNPAGYGGEFNGQGVPPPGYVPPGDDPVERWRSTAIAALNYTGQDPRWVDLMLRRIGQESGGNPGAVNTWDSNAARGDPTTGLMQNIPSAFAERAQELAGRGIRDGFANMVAAIRYSIGRYGDLGTAWNRRGGY